MSRWKLLDTWDRDLPGLTDDQLRERLELSRQYEASADRRGMGRNPKAARLWRAKRQAAEMEARRRGMPLA